MIYIYIYIYIHIISYYIKPVPGAGTGWVPSLMGTYTRSPLEDFPSFRTQPLENLTPIPTNKYISEQPSPWRKSSKRKSCYGYRV